MEFTKDKLQQVFMDLADKYEKECGDWKKESVPPELTARILVKVAELENQSKR